MERTRFVAEVDGKVVGTVAAGPGELDGAAALTSLWVDPAARNRGVGSELVEAVEEWARDEGYDQVLLWVTEVNDNAERLYERHGFTRTGRVSEVRPGEPPIECEMRKSISP